MFGRNAATPQTETTPFYPASPYASYTYVVCEQDLPNQVNSDILFNYSPDQNNTSARKMIRFVYCGLSGVS